MMRMKSAGTAPAISFVQTMGIARMASSRSGVTGPGWHPNGPVPQARIALDGAARDCLASVSSG